MKIVVPVEEDKKTIAKRTGHCAYFAIYEDDKLVDFVPNMHHDGEHHGKYHEDDHSHMGHEEHVKAHRKDILSLNGCDTILVRAVGENMREALESLGLKVKKIRQKDGIRADEVIANFLNGNI